VAIANGHNFMLSCTIFLCKKLLGNLVSSGDKSQKIIKHNQSTISKGNIFKPSRHDEFIPTITAQDCWHNKQTTRPTEPRTMPPPGLQIYLQPCVTLTFEILNSKVKRFMPLPCRSLVSIGIKIGLFVFKIFCSEVWQQMGTGWEHYASVCQSGLAEA